MDDETARRMHRLLADGKLSRPETDAIRESVLDAIERQEKPARVIRYVYWAGAALAAAAAVLLAINLPSAPNGNVHVPEEGLFAASVLEVSCSPGTLRACPASSALVFTLSGNPAHGYLSAYAEPLGHAAEPVFFFSKQDQTAELALPAQGPRLSTRTIPLSSHHPGRYRIHAFLTARPLSREQMQTGPRAQGVLATTRVEVVIVESP